tara:strand:- start:2859 stop:3068 length:210 start_codon:yes stop_codon:yes gene_type:complete
MGRKLTAPAEPLGPAINWLAAVELFREVLIVTVSPTVLTDTVIGPVWEVTMVLIEPAALNATHVLPFQM